MSYIPPKKIHCMKKFEKENQNLNRRVPFFFILLRPTQIQRSYPCILLCNKWENSLAKHCYTLQQ